MHCKTEGCQHTTRQPNYAECWSEWNLCRLCAVELGLVNPRFGYCFSRRFES